MCVHMLDTVRWMLGLGWPKRVASAGGIYVQKEGKSNIADHAGRHLRIRPLQRRVAAPHLGLAHRSGLSLGAIPARREGRAQGKHHARRLHPPRQEGKTIHFDCFYEREKYPEDLTEKKIELNAAPATRRHMLDFLAAIDRRSRPVADIEQGHISTATCILANLAMRVGRPLDYDPKTRTVVGDAEATALLRRPYRKPWQHPEPGAV